MIQAGKPRRFSFGFSGKNAVQGTNLLFADEAIEIELTHRGVQEKNDVANQIEPFEAVGGGKVKNARKLLALGIMGIVGAGLLMAGCKSTPELTQAEAQAMIQAKYDQMTPKGAIILVDEQGLQRGVTAKYWERTKVYNRFWGDFTLTPEGKKVLSLQKGGDVIHWQPLNAGDKNYTFAVMTVAANRFKAHVTDDPQDDVGSTKTVSYQENVNLEGVPDDLKIMSSGPGNRLSTKHVATFALDGGAWKLQSTN